jgi:predicted ABC-type transport system involved in lysophospholipase L1 biosynthesis ATPase subunit
VDVETGENQENSPLLTGRSLYKTYNRDTPGAVGVLSGVDIEVSKGESVAITGPSGSGKTTLLNILGTLDQADEGLVTLGGVDTASLDQRGLARLRNRTVGFVFQLHHLLPHLTALENVLLPASLPGAAGSVKRGRELLEQVGLAQRMDALPGELSGGERQRVAVVRALVNKPALLLCDEPTGSLDHAGAKGLGDLLFDMVSQEGASLVLVTHSPELASRAHRRMSLADGRLDAV